MAFQGPAFDMDDYHPQLREKPRAPYTRGPSRSSTRTAPVLSSGIASPPNVGRSPMYSHPHPIHRLQQSDSTLRPRSPQTTPRPRLPREASMDSARKLAVSQYLQDELSKQRKAESEKSTIASNSEGNLSSSNLDRESRKTSSEWSNDSESHRPKSSETDQRSEMGLRDVRRTINQLTNENFDLKFELFHRREKQPQLEARVEALEAEKARLEDFNEKMVVKIETRDKAIQEAVAMILKLEAKVDDMSRGLDIIRQLQATPLVMSTLKEFDEREVDESAPAPSIPNVARAERETKTVQRMPSFLSDKSEATDNLRKVYLTNQGSALSLYRPFHASGSGAKGLSAGTMSPTMSTLSESSFPSVYGRRQDSTYDSELRPSNESRGPDRDENLQLPQNEDDILKFLRNKQALQTRAASSGAHMHGRLPSISDMIEASPLQRIERLDPVNYPRSASRPQSRDQESIGHRSTLSNKSPRARRTKEEKREALRRVFTDGNGGVRLGDFGLPPTPDTISSIPLRGLKPSTETLPKSKESETRPKLVPQAARGFDGELFNQRIDKNIFNLKGEDATAGVSLTEIPNLSPASTKPQDLSASPTSTRATSYFASDDPYRQRPQSADDTNTTISHRRAHEWTKDSEDDEANVPSLVSSDIWMRESARPDLDRGRSISPDLFGFPTSRGGWAPEHMHDPYLEESIGKPSVRMADPFSFPDGSFKGSAAPPPPDRRSSIFAPIGLVVDDSPSQGQGSEAVQQRNSNRVQRFMRRNSDAANIRDGQKTPVQGSLRKPDLDKKGHYPPIAGQVARTGLTRLFRRSIGGSSKPEPQQSQLLGEEPTMAQAPYERSASANWVSRSAAAAMDEERSSATPPPILRNPRQARDDAAEYYRSRPMTPELNESMSPELPIIGMRDGMHSPVYEGQGGAALGSNSSGGQRRKWLPSFARSNSISLKNRIG